MKKWLSPFLLLSCFAGATAAESAAMNVDAITTVPLHVRSGPGKHYKSQDILPPDFPLVVGNCTRSWCQVYYNGPDGAKGWSSLHYLAFREGGKHYNDPNLGPFMGGNAGPRKKHGRYHRRIAYSVNGGQAMEYRGHDAHGRAGWWTNYHRPSYQRAWQPRWWQKKAQQ